MSTPRYTRPRDRTFAAIFGFILAVVVVVIEFLSHSRGVGQSFDTDEIFSRFRAPLHFACKKTHVLERKKKGCALRRKMESTRTRKRSNGVEDRRRAYLAGRCHHLRGFFFRWWWWFFSSQKGARFCAAGCVNLKRKKKMFWDKKRKGRKKRKREET